MVGNEPFPAGDLIQVCKTATGYALEGQAGCTDSDPGTGGSNKDGPGNVGEYYFNDGYSTGAGFPLPENSLGGLAYVPGANEVVDSALDPVDNVPESERVGNGVQFHNPATGARADAYRIRAGLGFPFPTLAVGDNLGASNSMGDMELLCAAAPIEIGNRVWNDQNGNGRQDPASRVWAG